MSSAIARASALAAALVLVLAAAQASAADRYDPRFRFRTTRTAHFDIHAHQGEEALARRLAIIAERVRARFEPVFGKPRGRVQVILVDQTDLSNGWATPVPYDAIEITAVAPPPESIIGNTTDWLEVVFTHEYTHVLHLDRTRGFMQGIRRVFGRVPVAFPNLFLPQWQIEGIATFEESRMTGEGRIPAGDFRALVDVGAAHGRFEPIDRVSGGLSDWPNGNGAYAYGAYFHQFLAERYGPERLSGLADASSGRVPLFGAPAFKAVYGKSLKELWADFRASRLDAVPLPSETDARATRLTRHGFVVTAPRVADDGSIYYATQNAHRFPALMRLRGNGVSSQVATRAGGGRTSVRGDWIVFDQVERARSVALFFDLYAVRTDGSGLRRLTRQARAADPDLSPDGTQIVCTVQQPGRRAIALLDFPARDAIPRILIEDAEADFAGPRWSPDGRRIVAERRRGDGFDLVLIDPATREVRLLVSRRDARLITPSWTADGRTILFAADLGDASFNVFALDLDSGAVSQVTDTFGGAQFPELGANGTLTYVGYTPDGYDLFSVPTSPDQWKAVTFANAETRNREPVEPANREPVEPANREPVEPPNREPVEPANREPVEPANREPVEPANQEPGTREPENRSYSPWPTLRPTFWTPIIESDADELVVGAGTGMTDALGRHSYAASAGWSAHRARPDWNVAYVYDRWRPTLFASYADDTDPVRGGDVRSRELFAGALMRFRHVRFSETLLAGFDAEHDTLACPGGCGTRVTSGDLRSFRGGWLHDSRRQFGYSISAEEGFAIEAAAESSPEAIGSDATAGAFILDVRGFRRVFAEHTVLAARAGLAASFGEGTARRIFSAAGPGPSYPVFDFGRDTIGLLRGIAADDVIGTRAVSLNVDLRFPLARPQRGRGSWPIFLHSLHGAVFVDAGHAWDATFRAADLKSSVGGELSIDLVLVHFLPVTLAGGAAWTHDGAVDRSRGALFARVGYAF